MTHEEREAIERLKFLAHTLLGRGAQATIEDLADAIVQEIRAAVEMQRKDPNGDRFEGEDDE